MQMCARWIEKIIGTSIFITVIVAVIFKVSNCQTIDEEIVNATSSNSNTNGGDDKVIAELDIKYTEDEWKWLQKNVVRDGDSVKKADKGERTKRRALYNKRWTNKIIPYTIANDFSTAEKQTIMAAINAYHQYSCIRFRAATARDKNKIVFKTGAGCWSYIGMSEKGVQTVQLAPNCRLKYIVIHELGHTVGMHHEQSRPDRDKYVTIMKENVLPKQLYNFESYNSKILNDYGLPYDYMSLMHYGDRVFTANGKPTMVAKDKRFEKIMGTSRFFSYGDVKLMNLMYSCNEKCPRKLKCPGEGFQAPNCKCYCPSKDPNNPVKLCNNRKSCQDDETISNCRAWARIRYCSRPETKRKCRKTCGLCDKTG